MSVERAEAELALAKAEEAWLVAKESGKKDAAYLKAEKALIDARNEWRNNFREAAGAQPEPVKAEAN